MTGKDIYKFANLMTHSDNRTVLSMIDGSEIVGYFESNNSDAIVSNKWNFVKTPIMDENNKFIEIYGNEINHIDILDLRT